MNKLDLKEVVEHLGTALKILSSVDIQDGRLRQRYAELLVAYNLAERGHEVQIGSERENKNADVYLPEKKIRVEVKSSLYLMRLNKPRTADASFRMGKQITENKFDYCVFVTFEGHDPQEMFVFSREELKEVAKPRPKIAQHPTTNACLLLYHGRYENYSSYLKHYGEPELDIEIKLHKNPEQYNRNWGKIQ